jgi:hypothetical protein
MAKNVFWLYIAANLVVFAVFIQPARDRLTQMVADRTWISFPYTEQYVAYNNQVMDDSTRENVRRLQEKVPEGAPLLAWLSVPFYLDYSQNPIAVVDTHGAKNLSRQFGRNEDKLREYLRAQGVRYVLWQRKGYGMRDPRRWSDGAPFYVSLHKLAKSSTITYADSAVVLFDLTSPQ